MSGLLLSETEKAYIVHGIQDNLRTDGRTCEDYRHVELETGLLTNAQGSCKLALGTTQVLVKFVCMVLQLFHNLSMLRTKYEGGSNKFCPWLFIG